MPIAEYEFSIYDDFVINHKVDITILQQEIENEESITKQVHHIDANLDEGLCVIYFYDELSDPEQVELDAIIAAHTGELVGGIAPGDVPEGGGVADIQFAYGDSGDDYHIQFDSSYYKIGSQIIFRGTNNLGTPIGIQMIVKGEGKIRIYDRTNSKQIFEWDWFKENDWTICSIPVSEFENQFPAAQAILELQAKQGWDGSDCYISYFQIVFSGTVLNNPPSSYPYSGGDDDD